MIGSKKTAVIFICIMLVVMTSVLSVGYASLSGHITLRGEAEYNEPAAIFITDVKVSDSSNVTGTPSVSKMGFVFFQHTNYTLKRQQSSSGGYVTIEVRIKNNSGVAQYFIGHEMNVNLPSTVVVTYSGIKVGELFAHGETRQFTITIQNTARWQDYAINGAESMLHFSPSFDAGTTEDVTRNVAGIFQDVLAGRGPDGKGGSITYKGKTVPADQIMQTLTNTMEDADTGGYIGNVGNASQDQKDLIAAIFGENITMQIGNQHYSVSLLIKNQQIDDKGQNDMVLYVTADQLEVGGGNWSRNSWQNLNIVPVYGIVFINNGNSGYSYCEHLFAGEAPVCDFGGSFGTSRTGSFNTNLWNSTDYPTLTDTSGGYINQYYSTTNGELDEAYQQYVKENP